VGFEPPVGELLYYKNIRLKKRRTTMPDLEGRLVEGGGKNDKKTRPTKMVTFISGNKEGCFNITLQ
jgi:hypothetical protein